MILVAVALVGGSLMGATAHAATGGKYSQKGQGYIGFKAGQLSIDSDIATKKLGVKIDIIDEMDLYGIYGVYNVTPAIGLEMDLLVSDKKHLDTMFYSMSQRVGSIGTYVTYKHELADTGIYGKAKLGAATTILDYNFAFLGRTKEGTAAQVDVAGGVGVGYLVSNRLALDVDYSKVGKDTTLLTFGANYKF